ncbi:DEAD/DEAH box helicase [Variovorax sp. J22R133]|uniref:DEAD/DEAH box helicase n=1 Tax=Variovorax brevis TaxID=3053503 RepID=UPI00257575B7|nr:DEAD/DEAH box helicase [Variovorax sp. J22R133]MDM0116877.1 DEAD/DEAH box helicase [Variovorax sp. J22R133]
MPSTSPKTKPSMLKRVAPTVTPFAHQELSLKFSAANEVVYDTSDPGTGKTLVRILAFARRRRKGGGCALVLAPKSLLTSVWFNDYKKFAPDMKVVVATADNRAEAFAEDADVYVTNLDAAVWLAKQKKNFFVKFDTLDVDEITAYKYHTSQRSKAAAKIACHFTYRAGMTGTPNGRSITDVWHQVYLLDGGHRLGPSFYGFRGSVCAPRQVGRDPRAVQWEDKEGAEEAVFGLLSDIVIRHKFEDCVDIPALHQYTVPYNLTKKQMTAYAQMEATQIMTLHKHTAASAAARLTNKVLLRPGVVPGVPIPAHATVTAINAAAVATKLLQIASGAVYESEGKYHLVDTGRYELILDLVEQRAHSLVFFHWTHQKDFLVKEATKRGISFAVIDGTVSDAERNRIVTAYQLGKYQTLFAHPKSTAHGYTFTKGNTTIWSSPTYDLEIFKQGSKRQHRIGQTQKTENIVIVAPGTIDEKVYDAMLTKDARMTNLLDLFGTITKEMA